MCFSGPSIPAPQLPQEAKLPDFGAMLAAKKKIQTLPGGTWLTGPSGITQTPGAFAAPTLLGTVGKTSLGG